MRLDEYNRLADQTQLKRRQDQDIRFMRDGQMNWPQWPILPLKKRTTPMEHGYLVSQDYLRNETIEGTSDLYGKPATVLVGNIFRLDLAHDQRIWFDTFEDLVAAGWTVD